jgi:uncharacterized protein
VTCLMPGATDTQFFERAQMLDTKVGSGKKDDPAQVAKVGFEAMMQDKPGVVTGLKNKLQVAASHVTPATWLARQHAKQAAPGTAQSSSQGKAWVAVAGAILGGVVLSGLLLSLSRSSPGPLTRLSGSSLRL